MDQAVRNAPNGAVAVEIRTETGLVIDRREIMAEPTIQELRDICAGKLPVALAIQERTAILSEIPMCLKDWWEDGEHYECLMDQGHREQKHGMRGMVRRLDA